VSPSILSVGWPTPTGHALPILAAGSNTVVELQVVADHRDARQHVRTIADQGRALEGRAHATVLDGIRLARRNTNLPEVISTCPPPKLTA